MRSEQPTRKWTCDVHNPGGTKQHLLLQSTTGFLIHVFNTAVKRTYTPATAFLTPFIQHGSAKQTTPVARCSKACWNRPPLSTLHLFNTGGYRKYSPATAFLAPSIQQGGAKQTTPVALFSTACWNQQPLSSRRLFNTGMQRKQPQ